MKIPLELHREGRMWWFLKQRPSGSSPRPEGRKAIEDAIVATTSDLAAALEERTYLKVAFPDTIAELVRWFASLDDLGQSSWIRERLFEYTYGRMAARAVRIRAHSAFDAPMFARAPVDRGSGRYIYLVPELGKNTVAFKLWLGEGFKADLQKLAAHAGISLSELVREAIIADLLGHGSLPERPAMFRLGTAGVAWERDEDVPCVVREAGGDVDGYVRGVWLADGENAPATMR